MKNWHIVQNHLYLREIFNEPLNISFKKGKSLKDIIVRAKMFDTGRDCVACHPLPFPISTYYTSKCQVDEEELRKSLPLWNPSEVLLHSSPCLSYATRPNFTLWYLISACLGHLCSNKLLMLNAVREWLCRVWFDIMGQGVQHVQSFFFLKVEPSGDAVSRWCVKSYSS